MNYFKKFGIAIVVVSLACSMALPSSQAQNRAYSNVIQLDSSGAYLGIQMEDVNAGNLSKYKLGSERGVIVQSVVKGSPAEAANIKEGDVILEFGGFQVWSSLQLTHLVRETPIGRKVELVISRDGKRVNLAATLEGLENRSADNFRDILPRELGPGQRSFQFRWPPEGPDSNVSPSASNKARLGVRIQPLTEQLGEFLGVPNKKGVLVSDVIEGSPSSGKLKSGDVIISVDGKDIDDPEELSQLIRAKSDGSVTLKVIRDKKEITVVVTLPSDEDPNGGYKL